MQCRVLYIALLSLSWTTFVLSEDKESCTAADTSRCGLPCKDDDESTSVCRDRALQGDCGTDPSWMLLHCQKSCLICLQDEIGVGVAQNPGFGQVPHEVSIEILQRVRQSHLYLRNEILQEVEYVLVRKDCRNHHGMCTFWAYRDHCLSEQYANFMEIECPLACQSCGSDIRKGRAFLRFLLDDLATTYNQHQPDEGHRNVVTDRKRTLSLLMETVHMNPELLGKRLDAEDGNWLHDLHYRTIALVPFLLLRLYDSADGPTDDKEAALLAAMHLEIPALAASTSRSLLMPYRDRGYIVSTMRDFDHLITRPIQLSVGFAIPNDAAVEKIASLNTPIVQIGAGAGYWSAMLRHHGVDVVAYDIAPPRQDGENVFFDVSYLSDIRKGACTNVFAGDSGSRSAQERTLLLIWPNDPDPVDNTQFCTDGGCDGSQDVWDAECLEAFVHAGGSTVVYVGERQAKIQSEDCGVSSTRRFQNLLQTHFVLVHTVNIPNWWLNEDDLTIWEKRTT